MSITTFIENYFRSKSIMTVRIPAVMDTTEFNVTEREFVSKRIILYAGNPGKKDSLDMMVDAVSNLTKSEQKITKSDFNLILFAKKKWLQHIPQHITALPPGNILPFLQCRHVT